LPEHCYSYLRKSIEGHIHRPVAREHDLPAIPLLGFRAGRTSI
jgi:hypothetical protein